jgi:hypothetical protein
VGSAGASTDEEDPVEQRPDPDDERPQEEPIPPDAPIETPEADPRTEGAPDGGPPRPADPSDPASTEEQIQEAFE